LDNPDNSPPEPSPRVERNNESGLVRETRSGT
jgi:hypothetical protein